MYNLNLNSNKMMMPTKGTEFKPIEELKNYTDKEKYFCEAIVFSPETENNHFIGCPPYIKISEHNNFDMEIYFEVPEIIAYYGTVHAGYTMTGNENQRDQGAHQLASGIKDLLEI